MEMQAYRDVLTQFFNLVLGASVDTDRLEKLSSFS